MTKQDFTQNTGLFLSEEEFAEIHGKYISSGMSFARFCRKWMKSGGMQSLLAKRQKKILELERRIVFLNDEAERDSANLKEEILWKADQLKEKTLEINNLLNQAEDIKKERDAAVSDLNATITALREARKKDEELHEESIRDYCGQALQEAERADGYLKELEAVKAELEEVRRQKNQAEDDLATVRKAMSILGITRTRSRSRTGRAEIRDDQQNPVHDAAFSRRTEVHAGSSLNRKQNKEERP